MIEEVVSLKPIPLAHGNRSTDRYSLERALQISSDMREASDLAKCLSVILGEQAKEARVKIEAISWREGIASLPDDVLSYILLYATRPDKLDPGTIVQSGHEVDTIYEAINLSHVCSRFRSLILNNPRIWNFLSDRFTNADMVSHVIKNAKKAPLAVYLDNMARIRVGTFESVVSACLAASARWKTVTLGQSYSSEKTGDRKRWRLQVLRDNSEAFSRLTKGYEFPALEYLSVCYNKVPIITNLREAIFHPHLHWSLPSLKNLHFSGGIPLPFENCATGVGICYAHQSGNILDLHQLQTFFASCSALERTFMQIMGWQSVVPCNTAKISGVESVEFRFDNCTMDAIRTIWSALDFQDAKKLSLKLDVPAHERDYDVLNLPDWGILLEDLLLQHSYVALECLELEFEPYTAPGNRVPFLPPFAKLSNLRHLKLSPYFHWCSIKLLGVPEGVHIPPLRSLTLVMEPIHWEHVSGWVVGLMRRLKEQGDLDAFELLRIHDLEDNHPKPSELKGEIHDYLPEHKIVIEAWPDHDEFFD